MSIQDELAKPFSETELKFFPAALNREKTMGKVAAYIDSRAVMDRLDAVVGPAKWNTSYRILDDATKAVECTLSIDFGGGENHNSAWRADVGYPNDAQDADNPAHEPLKAAYSDALKRAAVQFGIGRYIYSLQLEKDWLPVDQFGKFKEQPRPKASHGAQQQQSPATARSGGVSSRTAAAAPPNYSEFWSRAREYVGGGRDAKDKAFAKVIEMTGTRGIEGKSQAELDALLKEIQRSQPGAGCKHEHQAYDMFDGVARLICKDCGSVLEDEPIPA